MNEKNIYFFTQNDLRPEDLYIIANLSGTYVKFDRKLKNDFLIWKNHWPEFKRTMDTGNLYVINLLIDKRFS